MVKVMDNRCAGAVVAAESHEGRRAQAALLLDE